MVGIAYEARLQVTGYAAGLCFGSSLQVAVARVVAAAGATAARAVVRQAVRQAVRQ